MITIQVHSNSTGKAVSGVKVSISKSGFLGSTIGPKITNKDGEAHFDIAPFTGKVYVDGKEVDSGFISGKKIVYKK